VAGSDPGKKSAAPVIIRRKGGHHGGHHGGAWKVAYADFVTAMMAFFLVMWLVNQSPKVKESVGGYFRDPIGFSDKGGGSGALDGTTKPIALPVPTPVAEPAPPPPPPNPDREALETKGEDILRALRDVPGLEALAGQIEVELTPEGLRIQLMESEDATFFDLGSSRPSTKGAEALSTIGRVIAPTDFDLALEGHTDSRPYVNAQGYTNWELSADRANTARRLLELSGVDPTRIKAIRGYASTRLRLPELPEDPRNRRIAVLMLDSTAAMPATLTQ
jgi:chemotaxis protein MotB